MIYTRYYLGFYHHFPIDFGLFFIHKFSYKKPPSFFFPGSGFLIFLQGVFLNRKLRVAKGRQPRAKKTRGNSNGKHLSRDFSTFHPPPDAKAGAPVAGGLFGATPAAAPAAGIQLR